MIFIMKNPYYYLFYRLNHFYNKKGNNELGPMFGVSFFVALNMGAVFRKLLPITKENFAGPYKYSFILLLISIYVINSILFYNRKRVNRIMEQYEKESQTSKRIGGGLIVFYVLFSLGLIFI